MKTIQDYLNELRNLPSENEICISTESPTKTTKLSPELYEAYEERAGILQYEAGLDREEAERRAWCRHACILIFPSQWKMCERFKPKPCLKLTDRGEE